MRLRLELLQGRNPLNIIPNYRTFQSISLGTQKQNYFGIYAIFVMVNRLMFLINHEIKE